MSDDELLRHEIHISVDKAAGMEKARVTFQASSSTATLRGLAILVETFAELNELTIAEALSILTVTMLTPGIETEDEQEEIE